MSFWRFWRLKLKRRRNMTIPERIEYHRERCRRGLPTRKAGA